MGRLEIPSAMGGGVLPMIGPHGRVHMGGEHCRLRPMRRFQFEQRRLRDGAIENRGFGAGRVEAAGAVIGVGFEVASRPAYEIDGTLGWRYGVEPELVQPDFAVGGVWTAAGHELIGFGVYGESGYTHRLLRGSETLYEESNPPAPQSAPALMLDATGAIWRFDTDAGTMRRVGHWPDRPAPCLPHMDYRNFAFAEDGTLICISLTTWRLLALSPTDGSVLWELAADPGDPEAGFFGIVGPDLDGRIYLAMQRSSTPGDAPHLVAVQTDLRPPGTTSAGVAAVTDT
ncbi:MAG: hypothetical protein IPF99_35420 [Deltaproteobacteria bacterium]|nr:hypothetical protein [Deltaproteobacteria bacterium]